MSNRPHTPPPRPVPDAAPVNLTPEQVKRIELNRLRAKAKLRERESTRAESSSSATARNTNNKRPLQVISATNTSPTAPPKTSNSLRADPPPLKRDGMLGTYFEYDLSKMVNSKGGFLVEDLDRNDDRTKRLEKERADQRSQQKLEPPVYLDPSLNPKCVECETIDIDHQFKRIFGLLVCEKCKTAKPEKYSLLTKTECKEDYLLTDPELKDHDLLPHLLKANPHKSTYNNMMLFVRHQVETFAFQKWGSPEALDAEFERRTTEARKRKGKKFAQGLRDLRRKTRESEWQLRQDAEHRHEFGVVEASGNGPGAQRCIECGFTIEVEEL